MKTELFIVLAAAAPALAQAPIQVWARQAGTASADGVRALAPDGFGGVLVAGSTNGALGGPSAGVQDIFLMRRDGAGNQLWITQLGSASADTVNDVARGVGAASVIVGHTQGVLGAASQGAQDAFIVMHDGAGGFVNMVQFGTGQNDSATGIDKSGAGDAAVCGWSAGNMGAPNQGGDDAYLLRYDTAANALVWIRPFGTSGDDRAEAVAFFAGGIATVGSTEGNIGAPNAGQLDVFVTVYSATGNPLWSRQFGSALTEIPTDVAADGASGFVIAGHTLGAVQGTNAGGTDIFLARYDGAGNQTWIRQFGTTSFDLADRLELAGTSMFFTGTTSGGLWGLNAGGSDALLARIDPIANTMVWSHQYGTLADDDAWGLAVGDAGRIYVSGQTDGNLGGPNAGVSDAYLVRFAPPCYPDCNQSGSLTVADFGCFQGLYVLGDVDADCNGSGTLTLADFGCFQGQYVLGCP